MRSIITIGFIMAALQLTAQPKIAGYEYWIDNDHSKAVKQSVPPATVYHLSSEVPFQMLTAGLHLFNVRFYDDSSRYSGTLSNFFFKTSPYTGANSITRYRYWFDDQFGQVVTQPASGITLNLNVNFQTSSLSTGLHLIHFQVADQQGTWSSALTQFFFKVAEATTPNGLTAWQYWIDDEYGQAISQTVSVSPAYILMKEINLQTLSTGLHSIHLRFRDARGLWSSPSTMFFIKTPARAETGNSIVKLQYWFDENYNSATMQNTSAMPEQSINTMVFTTNLATGLHVVHIRLQDASGFWSGTTSQLFYKPHLHAAPVLISAYRYWANGAGSVVVHVNLSAPANPHLLNLQLPLDSLDEGTHTIHFQWKDASGMWSSPTTDTFTVPIYEKYIFTGNGLWSNAVNWQEGKKPPLELPAGKTIIINHIIGGECVLDVQQHIMPGARFRVLPGRKLVVPGNFKFEKW